MSNDETRPTIARLQHSIRQADEDNAALRMENEALRAVVVQAGVPTAWRPCDGRGSAIVRCGHCGKYLRRQYLSRHLDHHRQPEPPTNPLRVWRRG